MARTLLGRRAMRLSTITTTTTTTLSVLGLTIALLTGCSDEAPASELRAATPLAEADAKAPGVAVQDGGFLYLAYDEHLDRVELATGTREVVAGPEYAVCPDDPARTWRAYLSDRGNPSFAVKDGIVYLGAEQCGLWSWDVQAKRATSLMSDGAVGSGQGIWGGKPGRAWSTPWPVNVNAKADGLDVCIVFGETRPTGDPANPFVREEGIEVWSIGFDGTQRSLVTRIVEPKGENRFYCSAMSSDAEGVYVAAGRGLYRARRDAPRPESSAEKVLSFEIPHVKQLVQDESLLFVMDVGRIVALDKKGQAPVREVVAPVPLSDPARTLLAAQDGRLFFFDGGALKSVPREGGATTLLVDWKKDVHGAWPVGGYVASNALYFVAFDTTTKRSTTGATTTAANEVGYYPAKLAR